MTCNVIATGSKGNAVQLGGCLLLDCGVPFKALSSCHKELKLVLLTHLHSDHFNRATVKKLATERPLLRFGCCEWMVGALIALGVSRSRIDLYETGAWYEYGDIKVSPVELIHDVPNCGYRLEIDGKKALYATDTGSMCGVDAPQYDLYMIEANHTEAEFQERIEQKLQAGEFVYEYRAAVGHLSKEKADAFLAENVY
jgi:ribonuclease BN (tRNA processing enzyme)